MERKPTPHLDKIVGIPKGHEEQKIKVAEHLTARFEHSKEKYSQELEKSNEDLILIDFAQNALDEILAQYGRKNVVHLSYDQVHIFKLGGVEEYTEGRLLNGAQSTLSGDFIIDRAERKVDFVLTLFHEMVHAKVYTAAQVIFKEDSAELSSYRSGLNVDRRDGKGVYFDDINEAIVGYLTKKFYEEYVRKSDFFKEDIKDIDEGKFEVDTSRQSELRDLLNYVDKLYEIHKDKHTREEILNMFLDAGVNGNLMAVGRLIEKTFGKGSFRELGRQTGHKKSKD